MAQNIYDDPVFFAGYSQLPRSREGLAGAPEWPTLRRMLPALEGARVLDLGCGFGAFARWAREMGAARVLGVDRSENMLARARAQTRDPGVTYDLVDIEHLTLSDAAFDLVYSALTLHYLADFGAVCATIRRLLVPGGRLVFSVEHPLFTAPRHPGWRTEPDGTKGVCTISRVLIILMKLLLYKFINNMPNSEFLCKAAPRCGQSMHIFLRVDA